MNSVKIPSDAIISSTGATWLDESGIIIAVAINHAIHTLEHAIENHKINIRLAQGIRRPFLIDISEVKSMSSEARAFYAGTEPAKILTSVAMLTNSHMGTLIANAFLSLSKPILPTKMFTDFVEAKKWLKHYLITEV